jgi:hypothetical protein
LKGRSKRTRIVVALGVFWFVLHPSFLYYSALNESNVRLFPRFEEFNLDDSDFNLGIPNKTFGMTFIISRFLRSEYLLLSEVSSLFSKPLFSIRNS